MSILPSKPGESRQQLHARASAEWLRINAEKPHGLSSSQYDQHKKLRDYLTTPQPMKQIKLL